MSLQSGQQRAAIAVLKVSVKEGDRRTVSEVPLYDGQTLRIGRMESNDLVLQDSKVSRFHAIINASKSGVVISDLSSKNGTFIGDKRITAPVDLSNGDEIEVGSYLLKIELSMQDGGAPRESTETALTQMQPSEVTVLLVDVCGYTKLTQSLPEEEVADMLRTWLNYAASVVTDSGGFVDKFIGDCVMALWKSETESPRELALQAAKAGEEIVRGTEHDPLFTSWRHREHFPWRCRAVLHSGTALLGILGGQGRANYTVLGDTVNIAFRIEQLADRFEEKLVTSEVTANLVFPDFALKSLGRFALEGRTGTVELFGKKV